MHTLVVLMVCIIFFLILRLRWDSQNYFVWRLPCNSSGIIIVWPEKSSFDTILLRSKFSSKFEIIIMKHCDDVIRLYFWCIKIGSFRLSVEHWRSILKLFILSTCNDFIENFFCLREDLIYPPFLVIEQHFS